MLLATLDTLRFVPAQIRSIPRGFQVPPWVAALLLGGLIVLGFILWKIRRDD